MSVSYNLKDGTFSAQCGERLFIKQGNFQEALSTNTSTVRAIRIKDTLGVGESIQAELPSGYIYTLALYKNVPFVCVKLRMHNSTNDTLVINKIVPVRAAVDVGKAAKELRILGCDGLTAADENRTSYTFLAMADPATRTGVVTGWLTHGRASGIVLSEPIESSVFIEGRSEYGKLFDRAGRNRRGRNVCDWIL